MKGLDAVPIGSILKIKTQARSDKFVMVVCPHGKRLLIDVASNVIDDAADWEYARRADAEEFMFERRVDRYVEVVELHGALTFEIAVRALSDLERTVLILAVVDALRVRGKSGRADQVLAATVRE